MCLSPCEALIKPRPKPRTKEQIIAALKSAARKLGHAPTSIELHLLSGISRSQVAWRFHGYRAAVFADNHHDPLPIAIGIGIDWIRAKAPPDTVFFVLTTKTTGKKGAFR